MARHMEEIFNFQKNIALNRQQKQRYRELHKRIRNEIDGVFEKLIPYSIKENDAINIINCLRAINPKEGLEIGSFCGVSTSFFLLEFSHLKLDCVDPWVPFEIQDPLSVFEKITHPYKNRITAFQQYFGSRNPNFGGDISESKSVFFPSRNYDFAFVDGDHRTTSTVLSFMLLKEYTNYIIFHDALFPQRIKAFEIIMKEWANYWHMHTFINGEDGVTVFIKNLNSNVKSV